MPSKLPARSETPADVCLLLEGTYPYVRGGVSTWVHQIITAMPDLKFRLVFVGAEKSQTGDALYEIPENVISLTETYLFGTGEDSSKALPKKPFEDAFRKLAALLFPEESRPEATGECVEDAFFAMAELAGSGASFDRFRQHPKVWDLLTEYYHRNFPETGFIDFFWNVRFLVRPLWRLLEVFPRLPDAKVYHSVSTGYAGLLGALAGKKNETPFLLSEHGIYVRERISELLRYEWSSSNRNGSSDAPASNGIAPLRKLWIDFFIELGRFSYDAAAGIVSLFEKNAALQMEFGASADRIQVIPNGIDLTRFDSIRKDRKDKRISNPERKNIGFYGRIVAIKDVRTLIRAARLTLDDTPDVRFFLVGPTDEEPDYFEECQKLAAELGIEEKLKFTGPAPPDQALPEFDLMVLSSVSEGLPFAVLEAFGSEMPVVATDVGSCHELIEGRSDENPFLGSAGRVVPAGDPTALASGLIEIISDRQLQDRLAAAGRTRVEKYYAEKQVIAAYRKIYAALADSPATGTDADSTLLNRSPDPVGSTT